MELGMVLGQLQKLVSYSGAFEEIQVSVRGVSNVALGSCPKDKLALSPATKRLTSTGG